MLRRLIVARNACQRQFKWYASAIFFFWHGFAEEGLSLSGKGLSLSEEGLSLSEEGREIGEGILTG